MNEWRENKTQRDWIKQRNNGSIIIITIRSLKKRTRLTTELLLKKIYTAFSVTNVGEKLIQMQELKVSVLSEVTGVSWPKKVVSEWERSLNMYLPKIVCFVNDVLWRSYFLYLTLLLLLLSLSINFYYSFYYSIKNPYNTVLAVKYMLRLF